MQIVLGFLSADIFAVGYILFIITFLALCYNNMKKNNKMPKIDLSMIILILFCILFFVISSKYEKDSIYLLIIPILAFYIGKLLAKNNENKEEYLTACIFAIILGEFAHAMLNFIANDITMTRQKYI